MNNHGNSEIRFRLVYLSDSPNLCFNSKQSTQRKREYFKFFVNFASFCFRSAFASRSTTSRSYAERRATNARCAARRLQFYQRQEVRYACPSITLPLISPSLSLSHSLSRALHRNIQLLSGGYQPPKAVRTGTSIVGIIFADGVILGADTRATEGPIVSDKNCSKIHRLQDHIL